MLRIHLGAFNLPPPVAVWGGCKPDQFLSATILLFSQNPSDVHASKTLTRLNGCNWAKYYGENHIGRYGGSRLNAALGRPSRLPDL